MSIAMKTRTRRGVGRVLLYVGLLIGAAFAGFPVLWMLSSSFKSNANIFAYPPKLVDGSFSLEAYLAVLTDPVKIGYFVNSYIVALRDFWIAQSDLDMALIGKPSLTAAVGPAMATEAGAAEH